MIHVSEQFSSISRPEGSISREHQSISRSVQYQPVEVHVLHLPSTPAVWAELASALPPWMIRRSIYLMASPPCHPIGKKEPFQCIFEWDVRQIATLNECIYESAKFNVHRVSWGGGAPVCPEFLMIPSSYGWVEPYKKMRHPVIHWFCSNRHTRAVQSLTDSPKVNLFYEMFEWMSLIKALVPKPIRYR